MGSDRNNDASERLSAAAEWLARLDDTPTPETLADYRAWREENQANAAAVDRIEKDWQAMQSVKLLAPFAKNGPDPDLLLKLKKRRRPLVARAIAWGSLAALLVLALTQWFGQSPYPLALASGSDTLKRHVLEDGSVIKLNQNSRVSVDYSSYLRHISLEQGEAHFKVEKDVQRPFVVSASGYEVKAVGTAFNVRFEEREIEIIVTEGRVALLRSGDAPPPVRGKALLDPPPVMEPGARVTISTSDGEEVALERMDAESMERRLSWVTIKLEFSGESLDKVIDSFNRYNEQQLRISDSTISDIPIGGSFNAENVEAFVRLLSNDGRISVERVSEKLIVVRSSASTASMHH